MQQKVSALTTDEKARYERDGYLVRESVLRAGRDRDAAAGVRGAVRPAGGDVERGPQDRRVGVLRLRGRHGQGRDDQVGAREPRRHPGRRAGGSSPSGDRRVRQPPGAHRAVARSCSGFDAVSLYTEKLNTKRSGVGGAFALHRDLPYWVGASDDPEADADRAARARRRHRRQRCAPGAARQPPHRRPAVQGVRARVRAQRDRPRPDGHVGHGRRRGTGRERHLLRCPSGPHVGVEPVGERPPGAAVHLPAPRPARHARRQSRVVRQQ